MFERTENSRKRRLSRPEGGGVVGALLVLLVIGAVVAGVFWRINHSKTPKQVNVIYANVERGTFIHEVNGKGSVESAQNTTPRRKSKALRQLFI